MASSAYGHHPQGSHSQGHRGPSIPNIPPGTFPPGTPITVGQHKCTIERYLSEGKLLGPSGVPGDLCGSG